MSNDYPPEVLALWSKFGDFQHRAKYETAHPCAICGWASHMAIHHPIISGPRAGEPYDHTYQAYVAAGVPPTEGGQQ